MICFTFHIFIDIDNSSNSITAILVLPIVGQTSDYEEESSLEPTQPNNKLTNQFQSFSLSPVSAEISEPETETEEDQESRPYLNNDQKPKENFKRPTRPRSTPMLDSHSSPPINVF